MGDMPIKSPKEDREELVETNLFRCGFDRPEVLRTIAKNLREKSLIVGYRIVPTEAGHTYGGKEVEEVQYELRINITDPTVLEEVKREAYVEINKYWEVPCIEVNSTRVPRSYLEFVQDTPAQFDRFRRTRNINRVLGGTLALVIGALSYVGILHYGERERSDARDQAVENAFKIIQKTSDRVEELSFEQRVDRPAGLMKQIQNGKVELTEEETSKTLWEIVQEVRKAEAQLGQARKKE
jgi:hypothetical protein